MFGRSAIFVAACLLGACETTSAPDTSAAPSVGMSVVEYRRACWGDVANISDMGLHTIGECAHTPKEYVEFRAGSIVKTMTADELAKLVVNETCGLEVSQSCRDGARQKLAEHEYDKEMCSAAYLRDNPRPNSAGRAASAFARGFLGSEEVARLDAEREARKNPEQVRALCQRAFP